MGSFAIDARTTLLLLNLCCSAVTAAGVVVALVTADARGVWDKPKAPAADRSPRAA